MMINKPFFTTLGIIKYFYSTFTDDYWLYNIGTDRIIFLVVNFYYLKKYKHFRK